MNACLRTRRVAACTLVFCSALATSVLFAQSASSAAPSATLSSITVTGNPFGLVDAGRAESVLQGDALAERLRATLGETLATLPGVSSSYFGPTVSRPIIRGLDGERVRVLEDGAASVDAASLSPDHAVPIEPLSIARIEVLRGPAALLYGSNAIGGVVNAISNRIPRAQAQAFGADVSLTGATGDRARTAAGRLHGRAEALAFHVDGSVRESEDVRTPRFILDGESRDRIANSALKANSLALGASRVGGSGYFGASIDRYDSTYGIVATDDVTIDMQRTRLSVAGSAKLERVTPVSDVSTHIAFTDYKHSEIEGNAEAGTRFANRGLEWRVEAKTRTFGSWRGVAGASGERTRFTAVGEEAFVPPNTTRVLAGFGLVQWQRGASESQLGVRVESHRVTTDVVADEPGESRFGPTQSKHETLVNASASFAQTWAKHWIVRGTFAHTERAPTYFERFANGVHVATAAFERGDSALGKERADHIELGLAWNAGANRLKANVYTTRFKDFIALAPTGEVFEADEQEWRGPAREWARSEESKEPIPVFAFRAVPARFVGAEIESVTRLLRGARTLDLTTRWDVTRANNRETGEPLPRIAPMRLGAGLIWTHGAFRASADVLHARAQRRVPTSQREEPTAHYTLVSASLSYGFTLGANANAKVALRGSNLTNALAYSATSFSQVRERAPLPGRSVSLTLDMAF